MVHFRTGCSTRSLLLVLTFTALFGFISGVGWEEQAAPDTVKQWAERLGKSLSDLGRKVTREAEIKRLYKQLGALVVRRDGESLLAEIKKDIEEMVQEKMAAVKCLMETAEEVSYMPPNFVDELENADMLDGMFTYASSKFSPVGSEIEYPMPSPSPPPNYTTGIAHYRKPVPPVWYRPIELSPDPHFHNIPINDTYSTVHVPTNVYDRAPQVIEAIEWSEQLDRIFIANYRADPSLTWQYFGSASGFMRQYPGIQWKSERVDLYDCRTQPWYISAVTCSKDVVMLVDNSGSMTGMRFSIARLVAHSLLDTLTSNDFVSVMTFSDVITHPVPCFENMLVQATKENVKVLKESLDKAATEGYGNFTAAFATAFQLLESYRESRGCTGGCNQAIMLITDGVPGNLTEVFETYNRLNETGEETIPVRVFTYLLGKEVTNVREIQWMACLNRGYYTHMQSLEEVREEALRYLNVIARPLVLQGTFHPVVWTHAYADFQDRKVSVWLKEKMQLQMARNSKLSFTQIEEDKRFIKGAATEDDMPRKVQEFQLMTSVSIPVFDRHGNLRNNETTTAELLGVVGLDVPLYLFKRLTRPYKIGVNGYAFIVTNNGYILMHPDLRPVVQGYPRDNFNSVDLTEIELLDDGTEEPRELNEDMLELRKNMVEHEEGSSPNLKIKFSFDDMRRVGIENRDYFYTPVNGTPFTLGLALPPNYGRFTIGLGEKFRKIERAGITATNYFHGKNWRVHPEWMYCKHEHDAEHEFSTPEERLLHFLNLRDKADSSWKWKSDPLPQDSYKDGEIDACGRKPVTEDSYHCDQELVERLMLEAKALNSWFGTDTWDLREKKERDAVQQFNVSMRFVATHAGLTRWQHVPDSAEQETAFGDWNSRAIDEDWYKAAILLHEENPDSFLFSVPFDSGDNPDAPITGYTAVYHQDGGFEVPAAVVGFQMPLSEVQKHLHTVTESLASPECLQNSTSFEYCGCSSEEIACYLLDTNGYVVISEEVNDTGRFFGDVAPDAMVALHRLNVYRKVPLYDYQAMCIWEVQVHSGAAELLITPFRWIQYMLGWIVGQFIQILANDLLWNPIHAVEDVLYDDYDLPQVPSVIDVPAGDDDDEPIPRITIRVDSEPCDKLRYLALLELKAVDGPRIYVAPPPPEIDTDPTPFSDEINGNDTSTEQPEIQGSDEMQGDEPEKPESSKEQEENEVEELEAKDEIENEVVVDDDDIGLVVDDLEEDTEKPFIFIGRSVIAQRVMHTNLVLVVIDGLRAEGEAGPERWSPLAEQVNYDNTTHPCHKLPLNDLPRRRLAGCLSEHPLESEIEQCGRGGLQGAAHGLLVAMFLLAAIVPQLATIPH